MSAILERNACRSRRASRSAFGLRQSWGRGFGQHIFDGRDGALAFCHRLRASRCDAGSDLSFRTRAATPRGLGAIKRSAKELRTGTTVAVVEGSGFQLGLPPCESRSVRRAIRGGARHCREPRPAFRSGGANPATHECYFRWREAVSRVRWESQPLASKNSRNRRFFLEFDGLARSGWRRDAH
jgi:hypothetical protein